MKKIEFNQKRKVLVTTEDEVFEYNSYADMLGNFNDIKNTEQWANAHHSEDGESCVFVANIFHRNGKIVENHMTHDQAENYATQLNDYFAICEEYTVSD